MKRILVLCLVLALLPLAAVFAKKPTELSLWTFQKLHASFYQSMVPVWNAANPKKQINLKTEVFPYDDMHNKLLVALQSGVGAPDLSDIEVSKFANYLKGSIQLAPLNDLMDPIRDKFFQSRLAIYEKGGRLYGFDFHDGAASIWMPLWYMGRFTDYMPGLKYQMAIRPMPIFDGSVSGIKSSYLSTGMGGTGTAVSTQDRTKLQLAKEFLVWVKGSKEGNIAIWEQLGFDPMRWDVWTDPAMKEPNKFTRYYQNNDIFGMLVSIKNGLSREFGEFDSGGRAIP